MSNWKALVGAVIDDLDGFSDKIRARWRKIKGFDEPLTIIPYLGFGTTERLWLRGRVLEKKRDVIARETDGRRRNLANLYRRFATDEVAGARVRAVYKNIEQEVVTDDEGYFFLELSASGVVLDESPFQEIELEVLDPIVRLDDDEDVVDGGRTRAVGQILVPAATASFGVISDLDDTVVTTNVTNRLRMLLTVALRNEYTRMPFRGVAAFYEALRKGAGGDENNPIFYVSSSPWNLYPFLTEFLRLHNIPRGPLFLKDFGNHTIFNAGDHGEHKLGNIKMILDTYPQLPFVLIGDSGEQDPEIYREIVRQYPNRIRAVYIRSIDTRASRLAAIDRLIAEIAETGCQLVLAPDTEFAAVHAAAEKLIATEELSKIRAEKETESVLPEAAAAAAVRLDKVDGGA
jgi:phosphatidate phosphatase APP1